MGVPPPREGREEGAQLFEGLVRATTRPVDLIWLATLLDEKQLVDRRPGRGLVGLDRELRDAAEVFAVLVGGGDRRSQFDGSREDSSRFKKTSVRFARYGYL
jgi:hypothetical protein